jgi:protein-tyrosine-phosphatase
MNQKVAILFLCTHNSARSILAEALLNAMAGDRFIAYSAGSTPRESGKPNPLAISALNEAGIETRDLASKSWDEFIGPNAPHIDLVITVCGSASDLCPVFPGAPARAHWGYEDPSAGDAPDAVKIEAFRATLRLIRQRLAQLINLPEPALQRTTIEQSARHLAKA